MPDGLSTLIFNFGSPVMVRTATEQYTVAKSFFSGTISGYFDLFQQGTHEQVGIIFKPGGAYELLKIPLKEFHNKAIELDLISKTLFADIYENMQHSPTLERRLNLVHDWLFQILGSARVDPVISQFIYRLQGQEVPATKTIADQLGITQQHTGRLLNKYIGTNPKMLHRVVRFQKAIQTLQQQSFKSLTDIAYQNDYFDQAHFINEFQSFAGLTPGKVSDLITPNYSRLIIF